MKIYQDFAGHMTKMAVMPIYDKNTLKIVFPGTTGQILMKRKNHMNFQTKHVQMFV